MAAGAVWSLSMISDSPSIRTLTDTDIESIFSLDVSRTQTARYVVHCSRAAGGLLLNREQLATPAITATWGKNECQARRKLWRRNLREGARIWGVYTDAVLAGFVLISPLLPNNTIEVYSLFVDASHRRAGIGSVLLRIAEHEARKLSAVAVHLTTTLDNVVAIDFYLRHGYQMVQLSDCAVVQDKQPEIRLTKRLSP
jgi:ribosomal protein S18 acetylase RimI-like enzyme